MRLEIERRGARIWFTAPDGHRTSLLFGDAECLADLAARMDSADGASDVRIANIGLRRTKDTTQISLHGEDWSSTFRISTFDVGTLGRMLRQAVAARVFTGSIGVADCDDVQSIHSDDSTSGRTDGAPTRFAPRTPRPEFLAGGDISRFQVDLAKRRTRQTQPCLPRAFPDERGREVPTSSWHDFVTDELRIVDTLPSAIFNAVRALWHRFDTGHWIGVEWVQTYGGNDVWRTTRRDVAVTNREEISTLTMTDLERYGLVAMDDVGLRVAAQPLYDLWRSVQLAGGMDHRDERMTTPVPVPIGYAAPGMEQLADLDTCIVEFHEGRATLHPYKVGDWSIGTLLMSDLQKMGIDDPRRAEIATRMGEWLYPERNSMYGNNLANRLARSTGRSIAPQPLRGQIGWDVHFARLTELPPWQERALARYRRSLSAPDLPVIMPDAPRPDDWMDDPLLVNGAEKRRKQLAGRTQPKT